VSALAALRPDVVTAIGRIFAEEIERLTVRAVGVAGARSGSLGQTQRFGSSLNVHVHFHHVALDVAFEQRGERICAHEAPPPSCDALDELVTRVRDRTLLWLRKRGYLDERAAEERSSVRPTPSAIEGCTQLALSGGAFLARPFAASSNGEADLEHRERHFSASRDGFDVHCAVRIEAEDDEGRDHLCAFFASCDLSSTSAPSEGRAPRTRGAARCRHRAETRGDSRGRLPRP